MISYNSKLKGDGFRLGLKVMKFQLLVEIMNPYTLTGIAGIVSVSFAGCSGKSEAPGKKPKIVFILTD